MLNIKDLAINNDSYEIIDKLKTRCRYNDFFDMSNKLNNNISKISYNIISGRTEMITKDKYIYDVNILPIIQINRTSKMISWSWSKSSYTMFDTPYVKIPIDNFKINIKKKFNNISYFDFDSIKYNDNDKYIADNLIDDVVIVSKNILDAKAYYEYNTINKFYDDIAEILLIIKINNIKKIY